MILAIGRFRVADILDATVSMSTGRTADHDGPSNVHPDGWGAVWRESDAPHGLAVHRDVRPLAESLLESPLLGLTTDFVAVHARYATLSKNRGLACTHPLHRGGAKPWYFMHNGYMPMVHRNLGLPASDFDSREYFDWIVPAEAEQLEEQDCLDRLSSIEPGGSSGNAIVVNPRMAYLIHWSPVDIGAPRYFTMHSTQLMEGTVYASEVVPDLAPREAWSLVPPRCVLSFPFPALGR